MEIVLVPGLWLDGSSWDRVLPVLASGGHQVHPVTLPGMESANDDRSGVSLADCVAAVLSAIEEAASKVLLVGHSAGGALVHAAADARPERVARVVYVGGFPVGNGAAAAAEFQAHGSDLPLPRWDAFDDADLAGLDREGLDAFRQRAIPSPASLTTDLVDLSDDRRYDVPVTVICTEFTSETLQGWIEQDLGPVRELARVRHVEYVDLPTGHWPQFTRPEDLASAIAERAYAPYIDEFGRIHPEPMANEVITALGFLDYQRATLDWKTRGLDSEGFAATVASSSLSLGGLLKHMAWVEDNWFSYWLHNRERSDPWISVDWQADRDWDFTSAALDTPDQLRGMWRTAVARSRALTAAAIADGGFDRVADRTTAEGERATLRWIVQHMIEEYARHNGHADLLREAIDGETGE